MSMGRTLPSGDKDGFLAKVVSEICTLSFFFFFFTTILYPIKKKQTLLGEPVRHKDEIVRGKILGEGDLLMEAAKSQHAMDACSLYQDRRY